MASALQQNSDPAILLALGSRRQSSCIPGAVACCRARRSGRQIVTTIF
ncbi:hypothetical protein CFter6_2243 [Collimonas fungivorans]|uniref:Uncharacterized protein n=1 Tax=Collimonas fungivorans TaxID=158899 RepID=A0A127PAT2_9BURK|nr:hypothetical protein CFter6_2243 [Collimonas fungivorans]